MTEQEIRTAVAGTPKGANIKAVTERPVNLRVAYKGLPLFKRSTMTIRLGIPNDHREVVQQARLNGDRPAENQGLKGREWIEAPILMRSLKSGKMMVRMEPSSNKNERAKTTFFIRKAGIETEVKKEDYAHMMLGSELKSKSYDGCFDTGIDRIKRLHTFVAENEAEAIEA